MCENINSNPFAGLFTNVNDAVSFAAQGQDPTEPEDGKDTKEASSEVGEKIDKDDKMDQLLAEVFGVIISENRNKKFSPQLLLIESDSVEQAIFERLLLTEPKSKLITKSTKDQHLDKHVVQTDIFIYLFESYCRLQKFRKRDIDLVEVENVQHIIIRNASTALQEPGLFVGQKIYEQFIDLFKTDNSSSELPAFVSGMVDYLQSENPNTEQETINLTFSPILNIIHKEAKTSSLLLYQQYWFNVLQTFASFEPLAKMLLNYNTVRTVIGKDYAHTLLGSLFCLSCLPKQPNGAYDFFDKPFQQQSAVVDTNIWMALAAISESMQKVFHTLLKCSREVRHLTLQWLSDCLHRNEARGKLANSDLSIFGLTNDANIVSDGFMLNLCNVLLRLCQPFCDKPDDPKLLKIDPSYCCAEARNEDERRKKNLHIKGMFNETCLTPLAEDQRRPAASSFNFITECFFLTHRALDLGYRVVIEKLIRINQNLGRLQRMFNFAQSDGNVQVREFFSQRMETEMTSYLSLRASLLTPELLNMLAKFHAATAFWLMQVNMNTVNIDSPKNDSFAPEILREITFPLPHEVPDTLKCIPEFVVENAVSFICFLRRWSPNVFEQQGSIFLNPLLTEIIAFMESPNRLYNPHLRAHLAEGLEALLPNNEEVADQNVSTFGTFQREKLFAEHPHRQHIVANLLSVFVSIEMTGQNVQFEQKFNYRRPMYIVMEYLWKIGEQRECFKRLADEAENNMEAIQPPLFLRFINLLMNDAVFLLDDALQNMAQLKQIINARESGEWNNLSHQERERQELDLQQMGMIARFDNILGRKTIHTLEMLTSAITSIFCHPTLVDRIASMLNYLLLQLVGPNKKNLKVKDQKEYDFDPANLVLNISKIYINLSQNESFTLAVSQDGRSYSPHLFKWAADVLVKIGGVPILGDLDEFAKKVDKTANEKMAEEEIFKDAPEDFLDPIMSTLMLDPVILPSSNIRVDRQTIARHLLSDQTDPFNRSPLTMDMVKSDIDLREKIKDWIEQKKRERDESAE